MLVVFIVWERLKEMSSSITAQAVMVILLYVCMSCAGK